MPSCNFAHSHDHEHDDDAGHSLRDYVDIPQVWCLNEEERNSCQKIIKPYEERFSTLPFLLSQFEDDDDEDPELLLHVPFVEAVTIKSISISGPMRTTDASHQGRNTAGPKSVKIFVDRDLDFDTARELPPDMKLDLLPPEHSLGDDGEPGTLDYPVRPSGKFQNIGSITMYFNDNFSGEEEYRQTEISFVGFKGKGTNMKRRAVEAVYESRGMLKDHKVPDGELGGRHHV